MTSPMTLPQMQATQKEKEEAGEEEEEGGHGWEWTCLRCPIVYAPNDDIYCIEASRRNKHGGGGDDVMALPQPIRARISDEAAENPVSDGSNRPLFSLSPVACRFRH